MIEEATRNAREAADKFAKDSGSDLGKIRQATRGVFSIEDRDQYSPYIKNVGVVTSVSYFWKVKPEDNKYIGKYIGHFFHALGYGKAVMLLRSEGASAHKT